MQEKDEEIAVLQAGMDECLKQLAELQQVIRENLPFTATSVY